MEMSLTLGDLDVTELELKKVIREVVGDARLANGDEVIAIEGDDGLRVVGAITEFKGNFLQGLKEFWGCQDLKRDGYTRMKKGGRGDGDGSGGGIMGW